jgi:dihydropyrimidine dehydrogenase (NAD+) subunit PreT
MKLGRVPTSGVHHCAIIGGGNTALDCVREALGLGIPRVTMIYRGTEDRMSGYAHEWKAAQTQGARVEWQALPVGYEGDGKVQAVRCQRLDAHKKPIEGSEFNVPAELVLVAIGQSKLGHMLAKLEGLAVVDGRVITNEDGATERRGWYAGGDCRNGGKEVVNAAAEGKAAAKAMHAYLMGVTHG